MFRPGIAQGILREGDALASPERAEDLIGVVCGLAVSVVRAQRQLMPHIVGAELQLKPIVIGVGTVRALADDAFAAIHAPQGTWNRWSRTGSYAGRARSFGKSAAIPAMYGFSLIDWNRLSRGFPHNAPRTPRRTGNLTLNSKRPPAGLLRTKVRRNAGLVERARIINAIRKIGSQGAAYRRAKGSQPGCLATGHRWKQP